ncbi:MAG: P1 family peptidase [Candidatus Limnocylindrales bacterium]
MPPATVHAGQPAPRCRARDLGLRIGTLPSGPTASILDVAGVRVGHATVWRDEPDPPRGRGVARTGVTAILPADPATLFGQRVPAGAAVLNGAGEAIGITGIVEWGVLETPIFLTSTMAIGRVYDAAVAALVELDPGIGVEDAILPCVAECDDGRLNHGRVVQVESADVRAALASARGAEVGPPAVGAVGAGTGMVCCQLKGGIGSASRVVTLARGPVNGSSAANSSKAGGPWTIGVLALTNFGRLERLTVDGVRVGETLLAEGWPTAGLPPGTHVPRDAAAARGDLDPARDRGSCIVVVATDAPLLGSQLERLARRAGLGLGRTGSFAGHGSGEIFLAFSTGIRIPRGGKELATAGHVPDPRLDPLFAAVVEATEEAVLDSLVAADTVTGRDGAAVPGLPLERTVQLLIAAGRPAHLPAGSVAGAASGGAE